LPTSAAPPSPVEDAAAATVAALESTPGVYNIVDSDPSELSVWLPAFAAFVRAPEPPRVSEAEALQSAGPDWIYYSTRFYFNTSDGDFP